MTNVPCISVILPVYNGSEFIEKAIESVLAQTFRDFELIIIDDGSTDDSAKKISAFKDSRIRMLHSEKNAGLISTLNKGIAAAKGEFIARMDADDISLPQRLALQLNFLERNPTIGVCGTLMQILDGKIKIQKRHYFDADSVKAAFILTNPLIHPSVLMRRNLFSATEVYSKDYPHAEDYALWISLLSRTKIAIIPQVLISYRAHAEQVSRKFNDTQKKSVKKAQLMLFDYLGIEADEEEKKLHISLFHEEYDKSEFYLAAVEKWLLKLLAANHKVKFFDQKALAFIIGEWWFRVNQELTMPGPGSYTNYKKSILSRGYNPPVKSIAKLRVKSILKNDKRK